MPTDWEIDFKIEDLMEENQRLRETIIRLKAEKEQLYSALVRAYIGAQKPDDPKA